MKIFITSDGLFKINGNIVPPGTCSLEITGDKLITIRNMFGRNPIIYETDVTTIESDEIGTKYQTLAAFLTAMKTFFNPYLITP